ncbi:MAG TPA: hypothetical protein VL728_12040 [Cyclobacteriaceae bacterium]|jgi:hypothetical protein|nr:hypothetical protein [Cyclobacteriaceae bacterium]
MLPEMKYTLPDKVIGPKGKVEVIEIIYDGNNGSHDRTEVDVSIAKIKWKGEAYLAIRWNVAADEYKDNDKVRGNTPCIGMPVSNGDPDWFVIPKETFNTNSAFFRDVIEKLGKE